MDTENDTVRVLLVEDTEDNRFMLRRLLEISGYEVIEARNGEEAVAFAREQLPDLILMDLGLPVIDGLVATRLIRGLPGLDRTPMIAVSAHETADFKAKALEAGCDGYITKPTDYGELEKLIDQLLKR